MQQAGAGAATACDRCGEHPPARHVKGRKVCTQCYVEELADLAVSDRDFFMAYILGCFEGYLDGCSDGMLRIVHDLTEGHES